MNDYESNIPIKEESLLYLFESNFPDFVIDTDDKELLYIVAADFARHLETLFEKSNLIEFEKGLNFIEKLHVNGDSFVKNLATIGILESFLNTSLMEYFNSENEIPNLRIESKKWWKQLNKFWNNEIKYIGETINSEE
jgi:hypothetical protein